MYHRELLLRIDQHLKVIRRARDLYASKLSPDFNAIGLLGPDEMRLSQILKELLSPVGSHAQGAIFLELFLSRFGLEKKFLHSDKANVSVEKTTDMLSNSMRRIDIYLDFGDGAIAIENKPWPCSGDQNNQCKDYLKQLVKKFPNNHCLIYLSNSGTHPSENSINPNTRATEEDAGNFRSIGYSELIDWLKDCRRECQSDRINSFLAEFIDYIQKQILGVEMTKMEEVVKVVLENQETLKAALEIATAHNEIRVFLLDKLQQQLKEKLPDWELDWKVTYSKKNGHFKIMFPRSRQYFVCFEFKYTQLGGFFYGIGKINGTLPDLHDVRSCLDQAIAHSGWTPESVNWIWFLDITGPYRDWNQSVDPWLDIQTGKMTDFIMEKTQAIYSALNNDNLLDRLNWDTRLL